ncbi:hypothetical protein WMY93_034134 [Mugilogobius chulae]|uniref:Ubiquitin-like protease family profile domain-containing protein n=1 Tax=Mugilogobius chulae TaxID=88201 RepID=A0AAW0MI70_9GOBI
MVLDSMALSEVWQGRSQHLKRMDVSKEVRAVGAICAQNHWTLVIMYVQDKRVVYVDPFGASAAQVKRCEQITSTCPKEVPSHKRLGLRDRGPPKQQDPTSCGVFVCKLAELLLEEKELVYPVDEAGVSRMRLQIARTLLDNTEDLSEICSNCGFRCTGGTDDANIIDDGPEEDEWVSYYA